MTVFGRLQRFWAVNILIKVLPHKSTGHYRNIANPTSKTVVSLHVENLTAPLQTGQQEKISGSRLNDGESNFMSEIERVGIHQKIQAVSVH